MSLVALPGATGPWLGLIPSRSIRTPPQCLPSVPARGFMRDRQAQTAVPHRRHGTLPRGPEQLPGKLQGLAGQECCEGHLDVRWSGGQGLPARDAVTGTTPRVCPCRPPLPGRGPFSGEGNS